MDFPTTLLVILLAVLTIALFTDLPSRFSPISFVKNYPGWIFGVQLLCVFIWQLLATRAEEYNVDESTWIANALAVIQEKNFFSALLTHTTARPVTVLPLIVINKIGFPINFYSIKVVSLVCIIFTLWLTYLSLRNLTNSRLAVLFTFPLTIFYLVVQFEDFLAYNSELVCNVAIASGVWLYSSVFRQRDTIWQICLVGLLLGLIPFAKFQAIPAALVVTGFCLYEWVRQRRITPFLLFIVFGLVPIIVAIIYCLITGQMTVLIRNYFLYYFHYAYQYSDKSLSKRFSPRDIIYYYRHQYTFATYWLGLLLLMGIGLWQSRHSKFRLSSTTLMAALFWLVSIYETIQAGTNYEHYLNLVLVPHTLLATLLLYHIIGLNQHRGVTSLLYGYVGIALVTTFFHHTTPYARGYTSPLPYDGEVIALIKKESRMQNRMAIWGWADRYYVLSGVAPASRYANTVFQMKSNAQQAYYLDQYALDLETNKPLLFLDAVAKNQFTYSDPRLYRHENFPTIAHIIATNYQLIYEREGLRAYKRKNEQ